MAHEETPRIVSADRFEDFIIVEFSNGKSGRYSSAMLYSILPEVEQLNEPASALDFDEPDASAH